MWAMGLLTGEALENGFAGASLGMECAGHIVAVGDGVSDLHVGDEVMGFAPHAFSSFVITEAAAVVRKPKHLSVEEAAGVATAFITAHYALEGLARLRPGERVLIHGAAGGVGLAAVQIAQHRQAEIFGTAGCPEKRDFLRRLGVDHVLNSRGLDFADDITRLTDGEGIDVVLNSLAGEAIPKSLGLLRRFGRFLEIGKRDLYANTRLGAAPVPQQPVVFRARRRSTVDSATRPRPRSAPGGGGAARIERLSTATVSSLSVRPGHGCLSPHAAVEAHRQDRRLDAGRRGRRRAGAGRPHSSSTRARAIWSPGA